MNSIKISLAVLAVAKLVTTSILATCIVGTNDILFAKWNHGSNQALSRHNAGNGDLPLI